MKTTLIAFIAASLVSVAALLGFAKPTDPVRAAKTGNACDSAGFLEAAAEAEKLRVTRRLNAEAFAKMAKEPNTIILDARGKEDFEQLRVKGSINLPYTAMAAESLQQAIPDQNTRILIYCRNNIVSSRPSTFPVEPTKPTKIEVIEEFPYPEDFELPQIPKGFSAGLNIPTYIKFYIYGYLNVWELDPVVDPNNSAIEFESGIPAQK